MQQLLADEVVLMKFGFRMLKQVLFGDATIPLRPDALEKRIARCAAATSDASAGQLIS